MELELSLGVPSAPVKSGTITTLLPSAHISSREDHKLVLELGLGVESANRAELDSRKAPMQQEEDHDASSQIESPVVRSPSGPPLFAFPDTGSVNSVVSIRRFNLNNVLADEDAAKMRSLTKSSLKIEVPLRQVAFQEAAKDGKNGGVGEGVRKKLKLSEEQSSFLEDSFKEHSSLTPKQKCDLARRLNVQPRQVEVWFQNRKARIKLKQTEVNCEHLRRCCETLTLENRRLQRELIELRALRTYLLLPPAHFTSRHLPAGFRNT